jgi:hypothetical protein
MGLAQRNRAQHQGDPAIYGDWRPPVNYYGISGCGFMVLLCVFILWASEHEKQVQQWFAYRVIRFKLFIFDVKTCLRCIANGEDL